MPDYTHSISFSGAAFYYPYELGVAAYLQKKYDLSKVCFLGASAGAFTSTLLSCEADIAGTVMGVKVFKNKKDEWKYRVTKDNSWIVNVNNYFECKGVYGYVVDAMKHANSEIPILGDNPDTKATSRATFSLTDMSSWWPINERISSFGKDAVVNYGFASAHIPWIVDGSFFASITDANGNAKKYIDGGVTDNQPVFNDKTIKVSPYMWSWIWGGYLPLGLLHFYGNTSMERNYKLYFDGYRHAAEHPEHWKDLPLRKRSHGSHNSTH
jgi:predicted acylesterase/phospholipase RssA